MLTALSVLLEPESCPRGPTPSGATRQEVAGTIGGGTPGRGWSDDTDRMTFLLSFGWANAAAQGDDVSIDGPTATLRAHPEQPAVAYPLAMRGREDGAELELGEAEIYNALRAGDGGSSRANNVLTPGLAVRRLTPRECERLMGWPDDHTRWAADGTEIADSLRYRMCGNGVVRQHGEWIGRRLVDVASELHQTTSAQQHQSDIA